MRVCSPSLLFLSTVAGPPARIFGIEVGGPCDCPAFVLVELEHEQSEAEIRVFERREHQHVGWVALDVVRYRCWSDRLLSLEVQFDTEDGDTVRNALVRQWGAHVQPDPWTDVYRWERGEGPTVCLDYTDAGVLTVTDPTLQVGWEHSLTRVLWLD